MKHCVLITGEELKKIIAKRFGVEADAVDLGPMRPESLQIVVDLGPFYVNKETIVKGE